MENNPRNQIQRFINESAEAALSGITDGSPVATFVLDHQHQVIHWNKAIEALTGIKREEIIGTRDHWRAFYNSDKEILADLILDGASAEEIERQYEGKSKKSRLIEGAYEAEDFFPILPGEKGKWLRFTASPIKDKDGQIIGAIETLEDITERKFAEEALRKSESKYRRLYDNQQYYLKEICRAQEEERKRIARELHDSTAQNLIAMLRQLENLLDDKSQIPLNQANSLWSIHERIRDILQEVRRFSRDLRPSILDDLGLIPALEWLTEEIRSNYNIETALTKTGEERRLTPEAELLFFRIVQESLNNVVKHARASKAEVKVQFAENSFAVTITDNGVGFSPPQHIGELLQTGKLGLAGMEERIQLLNGTLIITSEPGQGTSIRVEAAI